MWAHPILTGKAYQYTDFAICDSATRFAGGSDLKLMGSPNPIAFLLRKFIVVVIAVAMVSTSSAPARAQDITIDNPFTDIEVMLRAEGSSFTVDTDRPGFLRLGTLPDGLSAIWRDSDGVESSSELWLYSSNSKSATLTVLNASPEAGSQELRLQFEFSAEPFSEPNNTVDTATISESLANETRFFPNGDVEVFTDRAPGDGVLQANFVDTGDHPDLRIRWLSADGSELRPDFERSIRVEAGETYLSDVSANGTV